MEFRIADTFLDALARLPAQEQKAVKVSAMDLQMNPVSTGLQMHRIDQSKDRNFWSVRVNRDIRIIVHRTEASMLLAYVDHHDRAYSWAERRRIEAHPKTGAIQIVEVRERVVESPSLHLFTSAHAEAGPGAVSLPCFGKLTSDQLLAVGVPTDWIPDVLKADEDGFLALADHLPDEASEALLEYIGTGRLPIFQHLFDDSSGEKPAFSLLSQHAEDRSVPGHEMPVSRMESRSFEHSGEVRRLRAHYSEARQMPGQDLPGLPIESQGFEHPDALRRFRTVETAQELEQALNYPWEKWLVYLHPSQRAIIDQDFSGPARVAGSAGTGKTVVALHRAARSARSSPSARVLLTTFSRPLANMLEQKLAILCSNEPDGLSRVTVTPFHGVAQQLYELRFGRRPYVASQEMIEGLLAKAAKGQAAEDISPRFLMSEWVNVADAWQVQDEQQYAAVPRLGRKNRMGAQLRSRLWGIFAAVKASLTKIGAATWPQVLNELSQHYEMTPHKPFTHIVIDEAQDLGIAELRFLASIAPKTPNALFFAGDLGQRIFQQPFSWLGLGIDVRGRSETLKVNYRTSQQIREMSDHLLPPVLRDVDGIEEVHTGTVSEFNGPDPVVMKLQTPQEEMAAVAKWLIQMAGRAQHMSPADGLARGCKRHTRAAARSHRHRPARPHRQQYRCGPVGAGHCHRTP